MKTVFFANHAEVFAVQISSPLAAAELEKLAWLLSAEQLKEDSLQGTYVGPRKEIVTPWSTNATEITQNVGVNGVQRIEAFYPVPEGQSADCDPMLQSVYQGLSQSTLVISDQPEPIREIDDIEAYNLEAGLALSSEEIKYLEEICGSLGRKLTDSEIYAFGQINSEHCRHKIFNGTFVIDGKEQPESLFAMIKRTSKCSPDNLISAYQDNVAFIKGPDLLQFAPQHPDTAGLFENKNIKSVISLKAETHNFPTTVEPFNGASTGSGGEIRDRMAGGIGSLPLAGTAVYMTAYPRLGSASSVERENHLKERKWKYQTPTEILIKASNGASDFGNKFGQPLIVGSLLTYEGETPGGMSGFDRTIMLAGGIGYANKDHALKLSVSKGDKLVLFGGDNYRIGMAGGSVSSVDTGAYAEHLELSAVQRANPEMQKRVYNVIRALAEEARNPIKMLHDHGAGGHINCFSELLESEGGRVQLDKLPLGDPTLSAKEIICNESQERMGLIVAAEDIALLEKIAERERAPMYVVGEVTGENEIIFETDSGQRPFALPTEALFGSSPKTVIEDCKSSRTFSPLKTEFDSGSKLLAALEKVLALEGVACKDWLTNKVDRSVTGYVALQQCCGPFQLPLNNTGVTALDYLGKSGVATALGHAPVAGLIDEEAASVLSIAEALTNIVWAPLAKGLDSVVLSANWMWPAKQEGENARLYAAVESCSRFACQLGIPIPTGKDSLSMTMNYADGTVVKAPGTVVITAAAECSDVKLCVTPDLKAETGSLLLYLNLSGLNDCPLGGSSLAQALCQLGDKVPSVADAGLFKKGFNLIQDLVKERAILAGHDISSGGLITALAEMAFAGDYGFEVFFDGQEEETAAELFAEKPGVIIQVAAADADHILSRCGKSGIEARKLGTVKGNKIKVAAGQFSFEASVAELRRKWFEPSYLLERKQSAAAAAEERFKTFDKNPLCFIFPAGFTGKAADYGIDSTRAKSSGVNAAIIRDKGTNGDREMALSLFAAGFDVKDITMSDLMSGRVKLDDVNMIVFPGGFSNSDVLGAGRGWAGAFKYNDCARDALDAYFARSDTLSLGVCNGCQLVTELDLLYTEYESKVRMRRNKSRKFESAFLTVEIQDTGSIMLKELSGARLGIWVAHGEGNFHLPEGEKAYDIALKYTSADYPANPNGSDFNAAGICSKDGRHLAMMPHLERSIFPWQWAYRGNCLQPGHEVTPWVLAFKAAFNWVKNAG